MAIQDGSIVNIVNINAVTFMKRVAENGAPHPRAVFYEQRMGLFEDRTRVMKVTANNRN